MKLSPEQDDALMAVSRWLKAPGPQVFRLFGFAGTGKTMLAQHFAQGLDGDVLFAAFTGKAAQVMRARGCESARTLHSLIYRPRGEEVVEDEESGKTQVNPTFSLNRTSPVAKAKLVIVDECSMVDEALGRDLLSFGTPVLVLGDPGQLPPVSGGGFFTDHEPDAMLTEIHRQARDNPIIQLAQIVREGGTLDYGAYGDSRVISRGDIDSDRVLDADQVLLGINRTRRRYNQRIRQLKGFEGALPAAGDKLVCLRNNSEKGLLNGSLWQVMSVGRGKAQALSMMVRAEDEGPYANIVKIRVLKALFESAEEVPWAQRRNSDEFDYGYALTVHKAQGSQWDDVVLFDESFAFKETRERWLYTAITRAAERITIVR
ncbi:ATP-dependent RecD-like DNA helicase [Microbaculum sp. A6E488]|uniref:ATP-dependent RecD-like DNA helicase n=2 Tax=Microbaculum marinisediminis TaxID=2931392 RepID=A0AAW5R1C2_9HYPH|nr:ATP-dependent RecD-like DNA helicase [Microbaculum sp. A6E488]MCT8972668.1 ATP-dependent RecD-like DNA helicase [Microbaculum sp. A6E488]